ncbi:MAG: DUF2336 domain-containing protein, partial [Pseudomonadota bacterium]
MALLDLARDKSAQSRTRLLENIADLFMTSEGRLTEQERALMSDILTKLLVTIEADVRKWLAESLLKSGVEVPELHKLLANDEIEIARPLLEKSNLLRDPDLIEVVRMRSDEHRMVIAIRHNVSAEVADALIEHAGEEVIEALIRNGDAELSRRAMQYLVSESRRVDRYQEPLLSRDDLPAELAYKMYWWVSAALRQKVLRDFSVDSIALDEAMQEAARRAMSDHAEINSAAVRAQQLARKMNDAGELTVPFLIATLRQQRINLFVAGIAERAGVNFRTAWRIISDRGFESFVVAAKAIGIDRNEATTIVLLLAEAQNPAAVRRPDVLNTIIDLYDAVSPERARKILKVWQRDINYQKAINDLEAAGT